MCRVVQSQLTQGLLSLPPPRPPATLPTCLRRAWEHLLCGLDALQGSAVVQRCQHCSTLDGVHNVRRQLTGLADLQSVHNAMPYGRHLLCMVVSRVGECSGQAELKTS